MIKLLSTATALLIALVPAIASAESSEPTTFTYDGQTYQYTTEMVGTKKVLRGMVVNTRESFELRVSDKWVSGNFNGDPVVFSLKSVRPRKGIVVIEQIASR